MRPAGADMAKSRNVILINKDGGIVRTFFSTSHAEKELFCTKAAIAGRCRGVGKHPLSDDTDVAYCEMESIRAALRRLDLGEGKAEEIYRQVEGMP